MTGDVTAVPRGLTGRALARAIFDADLPEQYIRGIPAQSLYVAVKQLGLASATNLIEIATVEQVRLLLDFDIWSRDELDEDALWQWLALTDEEDDLHIQQRILRSIDLKIIAVLIARHVDVIFNEERSETPPAPGYYTPDKGGTWLGLRMEDPDHHFHFARFLALIFETNAELFYQLVGASQLNTPSMIEEEAFADRSKRIVAEGIPEAGYAAEICAPMERSKIRELLAAEASPFEGHTDLSAIEPIIYFDPLPQPLASFIRAIPDHEEATLQLTLIMNAALVHWLVDFSDQTKMQLLLQQIRGAMNIGLELTLRDAEGRSMEEIAKIVPLRALYQLGLGSLFAVRKLAAQIPDAHAESSDEANLLLALLAALRNPLPLVPTFVNEAGLIVPGSDPKDQTLRAIEKVAELQGLEQVLFPIRARV